MKQNNTNSIRYPKETDEKLEKLSENLRRSKKELFCQMVDYFYRCKKDPSDAGDEILKKELSSGISRIIAFIRQQEKDFLLPLFSDTAILKNASNNQKDLLEKMEHYLIEENKQTSILTKQNLQITNALKYLMSKQKEKQVLKEQFIQLLDNYIYKREEMGWTTSGLKKEELVNRIKQSLKNL